MAERPTTTGPESDQRFRVERALEPRCEQQPATTPRRANDLQICPACARDLVYPLDWAPAPGRRWSVALRCPECEWQGGGIYSQNIVDQFDEVLDDGTQSLLDDLDLLTRANMEEEVERFVTAINGDLILPEDF